MKINETVLMNELKSGIYVRRKPKFKMVVLPPLLKIYSVQVPIKIEDLACGYIDICGMHDRKDIVIEIKGCSKSDDICGGTDLFWEATKILAYAQIKSAIDKKQYVPGILLPREMISTNIMALSIVLKIHLFAFYKDEETGKIHILDLTNKKTRD